MAFGDAHAVCALLMRADSYKFMNQALLDIANLQSSVDTLQNQVTELSNLVVQLTCKSQSTAFTDIYSRMNAYWNQYTGQNGVIGYVQDFAERLSDPDRGPFTREDEKKLQFISDWAERIGGTNGLLETNVYQMMLTFHDLLLKGPGGTNLGDGPLHDCAYARFSNWATYTDSVIDDRAYYQVGEAGR